MREDKDDTRQSWLRIEKSQANRSSPSMQQRGDNDFLFFKEEVSLSVPVSSHESHSEQLGVALSSTGGGVQRRALEAPAGGGLSASHYRRSLNTAALDAQIDHLLRHSLYAPLVQRSLTERDPVVVLHQHLEQQLQWARAQQFTLKLLITRASRNAKT
ncbi:Hypothetical protein, putative [Bodo saltans]|uniref:Uncharacterized protein n=1 Tax=Bodo saltans TaxID=75058 RepID=A0A0S4J6V3_BODSA|nr:Hypothetical protein, putative [Bodo saltans]|eukprot:CUG85820.1 Hypothetical protein, putative [Bodo saltans]